MEQIVRATYAEALAARQGVEKLLPLLALLDEPEGESPIMLILGALGDLTAAVQALDMQVAASNAKLDYLIAFGSRPPV